jgi:Ca-activated chloride channel family protein
MEGFRFQSPEWLLLLLLLPVAVWWRGRMARHAALLYPGRALLGPAVRTPRRRPGAWLATVRLLVFALVILALARPQSLKSESREDRRGINIVLALDFSGTMRTRDFLLEGRRVARADGLKHISADFIRGRPNDRIGLVTFDRDAHLASPLTLDQEWLLAQLKVERNGTGTAVGSALVVAADHLQRHTNETRVIVLMTDAENNSAGPPPDVVAEALRPLGIRVHAIQIVSPNDARPGGDLSEYLTRAAVRTGGEYSRVRNAADLEAVYRRIDRLEKQKLTEVRQKSWHELFPWLALPALGVFLGELVLGHTVWRRLP